MQDWGLYFSIDDVAGRILCMYVFGHVYRCVITVEAAIPKTCKNMLSEINPTLPNKVMAVVL